MVRRTINTGLYKIEKKTPELSYTIKPPEMQFEAWQPYNTLYIQ